MAGLATRQMLHAWKLSFTHPATGEAMTIKASRKLTFAPGKAIKDRLNG